MARFMGGVQGSRGEATRLGGEKSGIRAFAQGWHSGVKVYGAVDGADRDYFEVYATSGSSGTGHHEFLGVVRQDPKSGAVTFKRATKR